MDGVGVGVEETEVELVRGAGCRKRVVVVVMVWENRRMEWFIEVVREEVEEVVWCWRWEK